MKIIACAVKTIDGTVIAFAKPVRHYTIAQALYVFPVPIEEQGFLTSEGTFVNRTEALFIARKANQIIRKVGGDNLELYSENLW